MADSSFWAGSNHGGHAGPSAEQLAARAAMEMAENLLDKTIHAIERGDEVTARRIATRTAERPFEPHEQVWPGPWAAHMRLFMLVTDLVEEWPLDDHSWITVLNEIARDARGRQLTELQHLAAVLGSGWGRDLPSSVETAST